MKNLSSLQTEFLEAIFQNDSSILESFDDKNDKISAEDRFSIYINNVLFGLSELLEGKFPALKAMIGEECFQDLAISYAKAHIPATGDMVDFGDHLADYIRDIDTFKSYPYLSDLTRFEWVQQLSMEAKTDEIICSFEELIAKGEAALPNLKLDFCQHVKLLKSNWPVDQIWQMHIDEQATEINEGTYGFLIYRQDHNIIFARIENHLYSFIEALIQEKTILDSAQIAMSMSDEFDFFQALHMLFEQRLIQNIKGE